VNHNEELKDAIEHEIARHQWADVEVQKVLLEVAKNYVWRQGLIARIKFAVNVIGLLGFLGGTAIAVASVLGFEVIRR
jgi:hypothetical protein